MTYVIPNLANFFVNLRKRIRKMSPNLNCSFSVCCEFVCDSWGRAARLLTCVRLFHTDSWAQVTGSCLWFRLIQQLLESYHETNPVYCLNLTGDTAYTSFQGQSGKLGFARCVDCTTFSHFLLLTWKQDFRNPKGCTAWVYSGLQVHIWLLPCQGHRRSCEHPCQWPSAECCFPRAG